MAEFQVVFQPSGRRGTIEEGSTILTAARKLGVGIEASCGGMRVCGKCKVIVENGKFEKLGIESSTEHISAMSTEEAKILGEEAVSKGYRLACFTILHLIQQKQYKQHLLSPVTVQTQPLLPKQENVHGLDYSHSSAFLY